MVQTKASQKHSTLLINLSCLCAVATTHAQGADLATSSEQCATRITYKIHPSDFFHLHNLKLNNEKTVALVKRSTLLSVIKMSLFSC